MDHNCDVRKSMWWAGMSARVGFLSSDPFHCTNHKFYTLLSRYGIATYLIFVSQNRILLDYGTQHAGALKKNTVST